MTASIPSISSISHFPETLQKAAKSISQIDPSTIRNAMGFVKAEAIDMSKSFAMGTTFGWMYGITPPYSSGTLFAFSKSAAMRIYPTFHKLFKCTTETKIRNIFVNFLADLTTTAVANYASYQLGFPINPEGIIIMKVGSALIPTVLSAADAPLNKLPELLPEMVTTVALSTLFGVAVNRMGYEVHAPHIIKQQTSNVAMLLFIKKCFTTSEYFFLKSLEEISASEKSDNPATEETGGIEQQFQLSEAQKRLLKKTNFEVITSLAKSSALTYLFFAVMGYINSSNADMCMVNSTV